MGWKIHQFSIEKDIKINVHEIENYIDRELVFVYDITKRWFPNGAKCCCLYSLGGEGGAKEDVVVSKKRQSLC